MKPPCPLPAPQVLGWGRSVLLLGLCGAPLAQAQTAAAPDEPPLVLRDSAQLQEAVPGDALPSFLSGQFITGRPDLETAVDGQAQLRRNGFVLRADRLEYDQATDTAKARGGVRINRKGNVYEGPELLLQLDSFEGFFTQPSYRFLQNGAHGRAQRLDFLDEQRSVVHDASFTTCQPVPGASWVPDWLLRADQIRMDTAENEGEARGALLSFKGVGLLPIPYLSFPLNDERKSGLLPPTFGVDNLGGVQWTQPYYWNIAPNRDATFTPTLMTKRGVSLATEFRYLEPLYAGSTRLNWMPSDALRAGSRWGLNVAHQQQLPNDWAPGLNLTLNLNRVSDDDYWRDFSTGGGAQANPRLLTSDAVLTWSQPAWGGSFSNTVRTLKWQTLQDPAAPITPPYDRLPQIATRFNRPDWGGLDVVVDADLTQFTSDAQRTGQPNGQRFFTAVQLSRPWLLPAGFITPKLQWHATQYQFDAPLANGARSASRVLPTFSLDAGLVFERDGVWGGRNWIQTLEPRAFYVHTPYRDQSLLPNYDSGLSDFNLATVFTENAFVGNDRISDGRMLTLGATTRFLDPATGAEGARLSLAQRLRLNDQNVTLPGGAPVTDRISDLLLGASVSLAPQWSTSGTVQYNPKLGRTVRSVVGARYNPGRYRTVSAAYRFQREASEQLDLGWQWPLNDLWGDAGQELPPGMGQGPRRWYSVGRLNFSLRERKLVDSVLGLEYDGGCWLGRVVLERLQTSTASATQRLMFQLEFVGFTRLGVNPLKSLRDNVPNYETLRSPQPLPSRFSQYE